MRLDVNPWILTLLIAGVVSLMGWMLWLMAFFYRQFQISRLFDETSPYPNRQSRFESVDGIKIHYTVEGTGPDILLIHGIAANVYTWRLLVPLLAKKFRVWAIDLKGFGLSDKPRKSDYSMAAQADLTLKFLKQQELRSVVVVGSSLGGCVASEMAAQDPQYVTKLVLLDSPHAPEAFKFNFASAGAVIKLLSPFAGLLSPFVTIETVKPTMRIVYSDTYNITSEDVAAYLGPYMKSAASHTVFLLALKGLLEHAQIGRLRQLQKPVLLLWGAQDKLVPLKAGEKLHAELPLSHLYVHKSSGHHPQEEDPTWVAEKITTFIESNS